MNKSAGFFWVFFLLNDIPMYKPHNSKNTFGNIPIKNVHSTHPSYPLSPLETPPNNSIYNQTKDNSKPNQNHITNTSHNPNPNLHSPNTKTKKLGNNKWNDIHKQ
jgi:hypothetical protein